MVLFACASVYASALFKKSEGSEAVQNEAASLVEFFSHKEGAPVLLAMLNDGEFRAFFEGFDEVLVSFLALVRENRRLAEIVPILKMYLEMVDAERGEVVFDLYTGKAIDDQAKDAITKAVTTRIGKKAVMRCLVDEKVVGGFLAKGRSILVDATLTGELDSIYEDMLDALQCVEA